jgi:hypothetical protein
MCEWNKVREVGKKGLASFHPQEDQLYFVGNACSAEDLTLKSEFHSE